MSQMNLGKLVLIAVGAFVVIGGAAMYVHSLLLELDDKEEQAIKLTTELKNLELKERQLQQMRLKHAQWQAIALPPDLTVANTRYRTLLNNLALKNNLQVKKLTEGGVLQSGGAKNANLTPLTFQLSLEGTLPRVLAFFTDFYTLNLPHLIKSCTITPQAAGAEGRLEVNLTIEAVTLPGATPRDFLPAMPDKRVWALEALSAMAGAPAGMALFPSMLAPTGVFGGKKLAAQAGLEREYKKLTQKNVFAGLINPEAAKPVASALGPDKGILKYVQLTSITGNDLKTEATFRNRVTNKYVKVRAEGGFDSFDIRDESNQLVLKGKALSITERRLTFQSEGKTYVVGLGEFLEDVLKKPSKESPGEPDKKAPESEKKTADIKPPEGAKKTAEAAAADDCQDS